MFGQARSQSGPGLSINTNSANSLSAPGQAQQSGGLLGNSQPEKQAGGLFGLSTSNSQPQQTNSLFGQSVSNQGGGLLGLQGAKTQQQQQESGSMFGSLTTQSQGGSLFTQPSQPQGGSLFGASATQQTQPQQSGGLFSSLGQNQTQGQGQNSNPSSNSLFGGSTQNATSSLFPKATAPNQAQSQSSQQQQQQPPPSIFSASIGHFSQQQQSVPGVRISINELRPTTRFNDLHEELQKVIESVDNFIHGQMGLHGQCESMIGSIAESETNIPNDVEYCAKTLETLQDALENDAEAIAHAKGLVSVDARNAKLSFKVIQNMKTPQQYQPLGLWNIPNASQAVAPTLTDEDHPSSDLVSYFSQEADSMSTTLEGYKRSVAEVEAYLKGIEASTMQQMQQMAFTQGQDGKSKSAEDQVRELAAVLREFEKGILGVAGKVGEAREKVQEVMFGDFGSSNGRTRRF